MSVQAVHMGVMPTRRAQIPTGHSHARAGKVSMATVKRAQVCLACCDSCFNGVVLTWITIGVLDTAHTRSV